MKKLVDEPLGCSHLDWIMSKPLNPKKVGAIRSKVVALLKAVEGSDASAELEAILRNVSPLSKELSKDCQYFDDILTTTLSVIELRMRYQQSEDIALAIASDLATLPRPTRVFLPVSTKGTIPSGWHELPHGFGVLQLPYVGESLDSIPQQMQDLLVETFQPTPNRDPLASVRKRYLRGARFLSASSDGLPLRMLAKYAVGDAVDKLKFWTIFGQTFLHFRCENQRVFRGARSSEDYLIPILDSSNALFFDCELASQNEADLFSAVEVTEENFLNRMAGFENHFGKAFNLDGTIKRDFMGIFSGALWLFDCKAETNETVAFLNACIGLEAILGDDQKESITERLADRCAYILEKTQTGRENIRKEVRELYNNRSKLVHGRSRRLKNRRELDDAQSLLQRIVSAEIFNYLKAEADSTRNLPGIKSS